MNSIQQKICFHQLKKLLSQLEGAKTEENWFTAALSAVLSRSKKKLWIKAHSVKLIYTLVMMKDLMKTLFPLDKKLPSLT